jgi:hypothetical protein
MVEATYNVIKPDHGVPIKTWTKGVPLEDAARQQLLNVAQLPFIYKWVAAMPDVHWGIGATVGSVILTRGAIIPAAVGVDIGCGVMAGKTSLHANHLPDNLHGIRTAIEKAVPHGRTDNGGKNDRGAWSDAPALSAGTGGLCSTTLGAEECVARVEGQSPYTPPTHFVFSSIRNRGLKPLDLGAILNRKIKPAFAKVGICGVGWHTFRYTVGTFARGHGRALAHHPRLSASQQSECDEQILAGHMQRQAVGARQIGRRDFADRVLSQSKSTLIQ